MRRTTHPLTVMSPSEPCILHLAADNSIVTAHAWCTRHPQGGRQQHAAAAPGRVNRAPPSTP